MKRLISILFLASLAVFMNLPGPVPDFSTIWRIESSTGYGTAFPVKHMEDGFLVLTCAHVVHGNSSFRLRTRTGFYLGGRTVWTDSSADTALVRFKSEYRPALLRLSSMSPRPLSEGLVAGYPLGSELLHVSKVLFQLAPPRIDGLVAPGSSGSPVFCESGRVVGIIRGGELPRNIPPGGRVAMSWITYIANLRTVIANQR